MYKRQASNNPLIGLGTQLQLNGGYQQNTVRAGKSGLKMDRDFAKRVVKLSKGQKEKRKKIQEEVRMEEVAGFKNGGAVNVIPDGALHAHKHHLENVDEKFEDVTSKVFQLLQKRKAETLSNMQRLREKKSSLILMLLSN